MNVASGADRHLDIGLQVVEGHPLFPYFLEKRLAIPTSPFFIYRSVPRQRPLSLKRPPRFFGPRMKSEAIHIKCPSPFCDLWIWVKIVNFKNQGFPQCAVEWRCASQLQLH